ncbi:pyridoxamine 5'-phosphate oxidase family protein [Rhabdothermincola sediminis]|uniref:pyridoxamine 5'-phosphate oxidase family protein n=1 Tax=Rhabdothermincola sediminis TaxID=2751370 RepID=UPI001AA024DC|nr:pyridoxamine 5'-phosphate oxidase family protein [Rhabdothermincola sediminis]
MAAWEDVCRSSPELAPAVQRRFEAHGLGLLATIRTDGFPRVSGVEPLFTRGELWLGMMPESRKALDLQRNDRLSLHSATTDKELTEGDAKVTGRAVEVKDETTKQQFLRWFAEENGHAPDGPFHLFRVDVTELALIRPGGDHLVIESWRQGRGTRRIERR